MLKNKKKFSFERFRYVYLKVLTMLGIIKPKVVEVEPPICKEKHPVILFLEESFRTNVSENDDLESKFCFDSLDAIEMVLWCEDKFGIEIHEEEMDKYYKLKTVSELMSVYDSYAVKAWASEYKK